MKNWELLREVFFWLRGRWRLALGFCPACNSDAPLLDRCPCCAGSREFPCDRKKLWSVYRGLTR